MISFAEAIERSESYSKRHLLLGNGFSIACRPNIFHYGSLFGQADFSKNPNLPHVFEALDTQDFELAIHALERGAALAPIYSNGDGDSADAMRADANALKDILIETVARSHPEGPFDISDAEFQSCQNFLSHFVAGDNTGYIFTLNYDLLLYWTLMNSQDSSESTNVKLDKNDGFGNDEDEPDADYVVWRGESGAHNTRVYFLHGALQLFDSGHQLQKYTWVRKGERLVEQAREAIHDNKYPLFVSEGTSKAKLSKITHNGYLYQGYKIFGSNANQKKHCFFIHGHSLAENDDHFLKRIGRGKCAEVFIGIFGDINSAANQVIVKRARELSEMRGSFNPMQVTFYDSATAQVWG